MGNSSCCQDINVARDFHISSLISLNGQVPLEKVSRFLEKDERYFSFLNKQAIEVVLSFYRDYSFDNEDSLQLQQLLENYLSINLRILQHEQVQQNEKISFFTKMSKLIKKVKIQNQMAVDTLRLISERDINHWKLSKDQSEAERLEIIERIAEETFEDCRIDINHFFFLTVVLREEIAIRVETKTFDQVEKDVIEIINKLQKKYKPSTNLDTVEEIDLKFIETVKTKDIHNYQELHNLDLSQARNKIKKLTEFINEKAEAAKQKSEQFLKVIIPACQDKGVGFKQGVKVQSKKSHSAIQRVMEKLFEEEFQKKCSKYLQSSAYKEISNKSCSAEQFCKKEREYISEQIENIVNQMQKVNFQISDMLRAKCFFHTAKDIRDALKIINQNLKKQKECYILKVKSRFSEGQNKDLNLKLYIGNIVAQMQLALLSTFFAAQFNHKLYEIKRSKFSSSIKMVDSLFHSLSKNLFGNLADVLQHISQGTLLAIIKRSGMNYQSVKQLKEGFHKFLDTYQIEKLVKQYQNTYNIRLNPLDSQLKPIKPTNKDLALFYEHLNMSSKSLQFYQAMSPEKTEDEIQKLQKIGQLLRDSQKFGDALEYYEKCLQKVRQQNGQQSKKFLQIYSVIGSLYMSLSQYDKAEQTMKKCIQNTKKNFKKSELHAKILIFYGDFLVETGQFKEALKSYHEAEKITKEIQGENSSNYPIIWNKIAEAQIGEGDFTEALAAREKYLKLAKQNFGEIHPQYSHALNKLGNAYDQMGKYDQALSYFYQAQKLSRYLAQESWNYGLSLKNIGVTLFRLGKYEQSKSYFEKSLKIRKNIYGEEDLEYGTIVKQIGLCWWKMKEYEKAIECYRTRRTIQQKKVGKIHPEYANTLNFIALVYKDQAKFDEALKLYFESLEIYKKTVGSKHHRVAMTLNNIANVYRNQGKYEESVKYDKQSLQIKEEKLGKKHQSTAAGYFSIGQTLRMNKKYKEALDYYNKCLKVRLQMFGQKNLNVAAVYGSIAKTYFDLGDKEEGRKYEEKEAKATP